MPATLLGATNGVWGINAQQSGFLLDGSSQSYEQDEKMVKDIVGCDTGISMYNERINGTLTGYIPATSAFTGTIAATITLATAPTDYLIGNVTSGLYITKGINATQSNEDYRKLELNYTYNPTLSGS